MKALLIFLIIFFAMSLRADTLEYVVTSISTHPFVEDEVSEKFNVKLALNGKVNWTHLSGLAYTTEDGDSYHSYKGFFGQNSIGEPMGGASASIGILFGKTEVGLTAGGYFQDSKEFERRDIDLGMPGNLMPIIGIEINQRIYFSRTEFVKITNTLTPVVTNHALSIGADF